MAKSSVQVERSPDQALSYVRIAGVLDETFPGSEIASRLKGDTETVIVNCAGIQLITSFGVRAWMELVSALKQRRIDLYFVECSPKFVSELNQVVQFASHGRVLSANAPYSCPECNATRTAILRMDTDEDVIRRRQPPTYECMVCGAQMEFDDEPGLYFPGLEPHIGGTTNREVLAFLEAKLGYKADHEQQLRVQKVVSADTTVLSVAGTLDGSLEDRNLAEGLEGEVVIDMTGVLHVQKAGLRAWAGFVADAASRTRHLWVVGSPTLVIERAADGSGGAHTIIASVQLPYYCGNCDSTDFAAVSLGGREGMLVREGTLPERKCPTCKGPTKAMVGSRLLSRMQSLPEPHVPASVLKAVKQAAKQIEAARKAAAAKVTRSGVPTTTWVAVGIGVIVMGGGLAALGATMLMKSTENNQVNQGTAAPFGTPSPSTTNTEIERPAWIASKSPSSSYCADVGHQTHCVGVSAYTASLEEGAQQGLDGALEALTNFALLSSKDEAVLAQFQLYSPRRAELMEALEQEQVEGTGKTDALDKVLEAKERVAKLIRTQRPPGAPSQKADWFWEEYERTSGTGTEFLVYIRIDVSDTELEALRGYYARRIEAAGATLTAAVPGVGWLFDPAENDAAYVVDSGGALSKAGVHNGSVLVGPPTAMSSAENLAAAIEAKDGTLTARSGAALDSTQVLGAK